MALRCLLRNPYRFQKATVNCIRHQATFLIEVKEALDRPLEVRWEAASPLLQNAPMSDVLKLQPNQFAMILGYAPSALDWTASFSRSLAANTQLWEGCDLSNCIKIFSVLMRYGFPLEHVGVKIAERMLAIDTLIASEAGPLARYLSVNGVSQVVFNPLPLIMDCIHTNNLSYDFVNLMAYCERSRQFTRESVTEIANTIDLDHIPVDSLTPLFRTFAYLSAMSFFRPPLTVLAQKALPKVKEYVASQALPATDAAELLRSLVNIRPPLTWLDVLMPYILKDASNLPPASLCTVIFTLGMGTNGDRNDKVYIKQARFLLDAYSTTPSLFSEVDTQKMAYLCKGMAMLRVRHSPLLHYLAEHLMANEEILVQAPISHIRRIINAMAQLNFIHQGFFQKVFTLFESGAKRIPQRAGAEDLILVSAALVQAKLHSCILHSVFSSSVEVDRLKAFPFSTLLTLASIMRNNPEFELPGLSQSFLAQLNARLERQRASPPNLIGNKDVLARKKRESRVLTVLESLFPERSYVMGNTHSVGNVPVDAAFLLDGNGLAVNWSSTQLKPDTITRPLLASYKQKAIAVQLLNRDDSLGDSVDMACGPKVLEAIALKLDGWWVVQLQVEGKRVAEGSGAVFAARQALVAAGVVFGEDQHFAMRGLRYANEEQPTLSREPAEGSE